MATSVLTVNEEKLADLLHLFHNAQTSDDKFQAVSSLGKLGYLGLFGNDGKIKDPIYKSRVGDCGLYRRALGDSSDNATDIQLQKTSLFRAVNEGRKNSDDNAIESESKRQNKPLEIYRSPIEATSDLFKIPPYRMDKITEDEIRAKVHCKIFVDGAYGVFQRHETLIIYNDMDGISDFASTICGIGLSGKSNSPALFGEFSRGFLAMLNHCDSILISSISKQRVYFTILRQCPYSEASLLFPRISKDKCWWDYIVMEDGGVPSIPLSMFNEKLPDGSKIEEGTTITYFGVKNIPGGATLLFNVLNFATPFACLPAEATDMRYRDRPARLTGAGTTGYNEQNGDVEKMLEDRGHVRGHELPVIIKVFNTKKDAPTPEKRLDLTWKKGVVFFTRHGHTYYTLDVVQACEIVPKLQFIQNYFNVFVNMDNLDTDFVRSIWKPTRELDEANEKTRDLRETAMRVVEKNSELERIIQEKLQREVGGDELDQFVEELTEFDEGDLLPDDAVGKGKIVRQPGPEIKPDGSTAFVERKKHILAPGTEMKREPQNDLPPDWNTRLPALYHRRKKNVSVPADFKDTKP